MTTFELYNDAKIDKFSDDMTKSQRISDKIETKKISAIVNQATGGKKQKIQPTIHFGNGKKNTVKQPSAKTIIRNIKRKAELDEFIDSEISYREWEKNIIDTINNLSITQNSSAIQKTICSKDLQKLIKNKYQHKIDEISSRGEVAVVIELITYFLQDNITLIDKYMTKFEFYRKYFKQEITSHVEINNNNNE